MGEVPLLCQKRSELLRTLAEFRDSTWVGSVESPSEALGQLGQDEPASGMALEPLDGLCSKLRTNPGYWSYWSCYEHGTSLFL